MNLEQTNSNTHIKRNNAESRNFISIPENIQTIISQRWFYLYEWIGSQDVKESIERDFLEMLTKYGLFGAIFLIFFKLRANKLADASSAVAKTIHLYAWLLT